MRHYMVLAALVLAAASPAAAQQRQSAPLQEPAPVAAVAPAKEEAQTPTLYVSRAQIDAQLEATRRPNAMGEHDFLYIAAAVAVGVIVAALLLN